MKFKNKTTGAIVTIKSGDNSNVWYTKENDKTLLLLQADKFFSEYESLASKKKKGEAMKTDYAYCLNEGTCQHRRGCRRWIGNYPKEEVKELTNTGRDEYVDDEDCLPDYSNTDFPENNYELLDRFRLSTGKEFQ